MRLSRYEGDSRSGYQTFLHDMRLDIRSNNITGPAQFLVNIAYKTQYKENTLVVQEAIVKSLASAVVGLLKDRLSSIVKSKESFEEDIHERIVQHIREIRNWSQSIQFIDMPSPMNTDEDTVKLNIRTTPRHLRKMSGDFCDETIFLKEPNHYVLLGDPGSGKTTTMKRVVRYFFKDPLTNNDIFNYPLVILLRAQLSEE